MSCGSGASAASGGEGDDQEESSSSSPQHQNNSESVEDVLYNFRQQWQKELESPSKQSINKHQQKVNEVKYLQISSDDNIKNNFLESDEEKAKQLFLKGVEHEQNGKLYEAIQFYKRAVQLVPDIEFRLYESSKMAKPKPEDSPHHIPGNRESELNNKNKDLSQFDDELLDENLLSKIEKIVSKHGVVCQAEYEQRQTHMSSLPIELVLYILRWVVSSELDVLSLERCSTVCRGLYLCARDEEIWKLVCIRTWGINCGIPEMHGFTNWRQMFIERPRLRFNGCYISKTTYIRHGENSFQDQFYRPWYLIEYFRYLRFFPDGTVLMLTTADEPTVTCAYLKYKHSRGQGVLSGHYRLHSDKVVIVVKKPRDLSKQQTSHTRFRTRRKETQDNSGQTFHLELEIQSTRSRRFSSLSWCGYRVFIKNQNGTESSNNFEIVKSKFPPLWFSRVKSYHAESEHPLQ